MRKKIPMFFLGCESTCFSAGQKFWWSNPEARHHRKGLVSQASLLLVQETLNCWALAEHHDGLQGVHAWNTWRRWHWNLDIEKKFAPRFLLVLIMHFENCFVYCFLFPFMFEFMIFRTGLVLEKVQVSWYCWRNMWAIRTITGFCWYQDTGKHQAIELASSVEGGRLHFVPHQDEIGLHGNTTTSWQPLWWCSAFRQGQNLHANPGWEQEFMQFMAFQDWKKKKSVCKWIKLDQTGLTWTDYISFLANHPFYFG